jgi:hypothetical protein
MNDVVNLIVLRDVGYQVIGETLSVLLEVLYYLSHRDHQGLLQLLFVSFEDHTPKGLFLLY